LTTEAFKGLLNAILKKLIAFAIFGFTGLQMYSLVTQSCVTGAQTRSPPLGMHALAWE